MKTKSKSDTPETDAACGTGDYIHCVDDEFARRLERQRNALAAALREAVDTMKANAWHLENEMGGVAGHTKASIAVARAALAQVEGGEE